MAKTSKKYEWRDPTALSRVAIGVSAAFTLDFLFRAALPAIFGQAADYRNAPAPFNPPQTWALLADLAYLFLLLGVIPVLMWVRRVSCNAHSRGRTMAHSPLAAVIWFVVPFALWFVPYLVMAEIWEKSAPNKESQRHRIIAGWWGTYVAFCLATIAARYLPSLLISNLLGAAAGIFFMLVVRRLTRMQIEAHEADTIAGETTDVLQRVSN